MLRVEKTGHSGTLDPKASLALHTLARFGRKDPGGG
jgi:tRNA U55 pseudouridine synthase TruB